MKNINSWLLVAIIAIAISCNNNQKEENIKDVISYSKIDSLLNSIEYERIDSVWMKSRAKVFKDKNIENDWAETGVIVSDLDSDNIKDYIIIAKNHFHPQRDEHYAIITILGKSSKCYTIETFMVFPQEKFDGATDFELPSVTMVNEGNKKMIYFSLSRIIDCIAPKYYNKEKDTFEFANESPVEEQKEVSVSTNSEETLNITTRDLMSLNEIKLALLDAGKKKCDLLLGSPDRDDILYVGKENKLVRVYLNKVIDSDGKTKHLILFLRDNYKQKIFVEDIKAITDGEKAYFGIHYVEVNKGVVTSNSHHFGIGK